MMPLRLRKEVLIKSLVGFSAVRYTAYGKSIKVFGIRSCEVDKNAGKASDSESVRMLVVPIGSIFEAGDFDFRTGALFFRPFVSGLRHRPVAGCEGGRAAIKLSAAVVYGVPRQGIQAWGAQPTLPRQTQQTVMAKLS